MAQRFKTPITVEGAAAASSQAVAAKVDGDSQNRIQIDAGGKITWGDGSSAGDATLYRSAADALKTDDTFEASSGLITLTTAGTPTATLSDGAIAVDTSNNKFYFRSGSTWQEVSGGGATNSDTAPASPSNGDIWFETDTAKTFVWYEDGTSNQWVEIGAASAAANGADGSIQFSSGGAFSSDVALTFDSATDTLSTTNLQVNSQNITPYTGKRNLLINGAMQVYQRASSGAVSTSEGYVCADRWKSARTSGAGGTLSVNTTDAPEGFNNSLNYACTSAEATPTNETFVSQVLEGQDVQHIGYGKSWCKQATVSFWVKSNVTGTFNVWFFRWDGTRHIGRSYTINSADTWEYKTVLVPADTSNAVANDNTQGWEARFYLAAQSSWTGGTEASAWSAVSDNNRAPGNANINSSTSNYWRVTGVQVEVGDKATPFEHRSFGEELALCERYYQIGELIPATSGAGYYQAAGSTNFGQINTVSFRTHMRVLPSMSWSFTNVDNASLASYLVSARTVGLRVVAGSGSFPYFSYYASFTAAAEL